MFVSHIVRHITENSLRPLTVLDACAAPGGKTTAVIDALPEGSLVVANEFVGKRAAILRENLAKWGYPLTAVTQGDTSRFARTPETFDLIVADVPCSGEGMMRKDDDAVAQWSEALIAECASRQREILTNLWTALRQGGHLIYSTCTFNRQENEAILEWLRDTFGAESIEIPIKPEWNIQPELSGNARAYRFIPGLIEGEGLFMAALHKPETGETAVQPRKQKSPKGRQQGNVSAKDTVTKEIRNWISPNYNAEITIADGVITARFGTAGVYAAEFEMGIIKGRDAIPSQQLAMSTALNRDAFNQIEVDRTAALDYLRCEAITLPEGTPKGIVLLTHGNHPLGFAKNIGNRANNLYPRPWRILSALPTQLPETPFCSEATAVGSQT